MIACPGTGKGSRGVLRAASAAGAAQGAVSSERLKLSEEQGCCFVTQWILIIRIYYVVEDTCRGK